MACQNALGTDFYSSQINLIIIILVDHCCINVWATFLQLSSQCSLPTITGSAGELMS